MTVLIKPIKPDFSSRTTVEKEIWWKMVDFGLSMPVPLHKADLTKPFVYDRSFGVFYVPAAKHQSAMSLLLAWQLGKQNYLDIEPSDIDIHECNLSDTGVLSDYYLEHTKGTCFLSSVSKKIKAGKKGNLNSDELDCFGMVDYLMTGK